MVRRIKHWPLSVKCLLNEDVSEGEDEEEHWDDHNNKNI